MTKTWFFRFAFMVLAMLFGLQGRSQQATQWAAVDPDCFFLDLSNFWEGEDGGNYSCPILPETSFAEFTLHRRFFMPDSLPDNLMLWVGRYAWEMEVVLNDRFLGIGRAPFHELFMPLEKEWLRTGENQMSIRLIYVEDYPYCPLPMLGIWGGVGIIGSDRWADFKAPELPVASTTNDTVALLAPFYGREGHDFDEQIAARILLPLLKKNINKVYFWFEPDRQFLAMCKRMGLKRIFNLRENQAVCAINYYPYQPAVHGKTYRFWLDSLGHRTQYYGEFEGWNTHRVKEILPQNHIWFAFFTLLPFLSLALIKLASPAFFASMASSWLGGMGRNESSGENLYSSNVLNLMLNFLRVLSHGAFLALGFFFLQHLNLWNLTSRVFSQESLFTLIFNGNDSLSNLYLKLLSILTIWQGMKWTALWMVGRVFRQKQMPGKGFSFEVVSDFPMVLFLSLPWLIGLYTVEEGGEEMIRGILIFIGIFILRKLILMYAELSRTFNFSSAMKVLYICTLNVLPYLIWL